MCGEEFWQKYGMSFFRASEASGWRDLNAIFHRLKAARGNFRLTVEALPLLPFGPVMSAGSALAMNGPFNFE